MVKPTQQKKKKQSVCVLPPSSQPPPQQQGKPQRKTEKMVVMGADVKKSGQAKQPKLRRLPHREAFQRMNFLHQAAILTQQIGCGDVSRHCVRTMKRIGQRLVLRTNPEIKRTICKGCNTLLIPSQTSTVRIKPRPERHVVVTCNICGRFRRLRTRKDYQLFAPATVENL